MTAARSRLDTATADPPSSRPRPAWRSAPRLVSTRPTSPSTRGPEPVATAPAVPAATLPTAPPAPGPTDVPGATPDAAPAATPAPSPVRLPGRVSTLPLRREGPSKLTGVALYTDDLVFPGAWYGATIRSTEPHARLDGIELVPVGGEIRHQAEPVALVAAPDRATLRAARGHVRLRTTRLEPVFDPLVSEQVFAHHELGLGDVDAAMAGADLIIEGYSSLPPKPPPVSAWTTWAPSSSRTRARFIALWM